MKKFFYLFFLIIPFAFSRGQDKSKFDIQENSLGKISSGKSVTAENYKISNDKLEITMISGGYFTIGTTAGNSISKLDDLCSITYGHPYALTSYPLFSIDGNWHKPDEYFLNESDYVPKKDGDTLLIISSREGLFELEFRFVLHADEIATTLRMKNLDSAPHAIGGGFAFDPSLGRWGDGSIQLSSGFLENDTTYKILKDNKLNILEKSTGAKGLGISLSFNEDVQLIAANWNDTYQKNDPSFTYSELRKIYDLYLKFFFDEKQLQPGEEINCSATINLLAPDFSSKVFTRWDLPGFMVLSNNILFPKDFKSTLEINNTTQTALPCEVQYSYPAGLHGANEFSINVPADNRYFQQAAVTTDIFYENQIVKVQVKTKYNNETIDEITRNIFIPATPVSDSGLVVTIDTLITSSFPIVEFTFHVKKKENEYLLTNLQKENIFLYENNDKVTNFSFGKDTTEGATACDIVFVLDVTGSMGDEISKVRNNIIEFTDSLLARGVNYRLGMVTFLDAVENIYQFTTDAQLFQSWVGQQSAHGGGDIPENSLQALMTAANLSFRDDAKKIFIWITDADYHENDFFTNLKKDDVINELLLKDIRVHAIGSEAYKSAFYDPIINATDGNFYNIYGNFRDIMMDITRFKSANKYLISFTSKNVSSQNNEVELRIRFAGLGGNNIFNYNPGGKSSSAVYLKYYPNPFNPEINFMIDTRDFTKGDITIFNILGQRVKSYSINNESVQRIKWDAKNDFGMPVSAGFYIVKLNLLDNQNKHHIESAKILYLK